MQGRWDAWILSAFGACAVPGLIALELHAHLIFPGTLDQLLRVAGSIFIFGAAIFGTLLATYTGVLIGATAIPAWFLHRAQLPIHFETAGLGSAGALLELLGHRIPALNFLGFYAAAVESARRCRSSDTRTWLGLANSDRRNIQRSACACSAVFLLHSIRSTFVFNRCTCQPIWLDCSGQSFRLRSGICLRGGTVIFSCVFL